MRRRARVLRRSMTQAERIMWNMLRAHRLLDTGFKRQKPIGPYIVDFVCLSAKLVIEIDGGQHFSAAGTAADNRRDRYLAAKGYRTLRFSNHDVMTNRSGVIGTIASAIQASSSTPCFSPSLALPRKRGRGEDSRGMPL